MPEQWWLSQPPPCSFRLPQPGVIASTLQLGNLEQEPLLR